MHEVTPLTSVALLVGTAACNARCAHCAGIPHRAYAARRDGELDTALVHSTLAGCYARGARSLSISGSGEPTLSPDTVTKVLELVSGLRREGVEYSRVNLYTNGIRIGEDEGFCGEYLPHWRHLGLTTVYVTVHDPDRLRNAEGYGRSSYPDLRTIVSRIHGAELRMRANLLLSKRTIGTADKFISAIDYLRSVGADRISAWPLRGLDDQVDPALSPPERELDRMEAWITTNQDPTCPVALLRERDHGEYENGRKLTLFPDGTLSSKWCNRREDARCV